MKKLLALVALGALVSAPAFAQSPRTRYHTGPSYQYGHPYDAGGQHNQNPDFQLGNGKIEDRTG
jgi:hypothetical protein